MENKENFYLEDIQRESEEIRRFSTISMENKSMETEERQ